MKKLITLLLALVMVVGAFAACTGDKPAVTTPEGTDPKPVESTPAPSTNNGGNGTTGGTSTDPLPPTAYDLNLDLDAIDYGGEDFYIYHWNSENPEFDVDEEAVEGDPINNAIYTRNLRLEEDLGVTIDFHEETGHGRNYDNFVDKLELRLSDPETPVDLLACYSRCAPFLLVAGHYVDLLPYEDSLDLSKAWWPSLVREEHEIKGRVFYVSGDASTGLLMQMQALFVNKTLLGQYGINYESFMEDVINVKKGSGWTIDKLMEIIKDTYQDIDGETGETHGDFYGLIGDSFYAIDTFWTGFGYRLFDMSTKDDELYKVSNDLAGTVATDFVKMMTEWANTPSAELTKEGTWPRAEACEHFGSAGCMFLTLRIGHFDATVAEVDYSVVPAPKKNADQERYYTVMGNPYSLYGICKDSKNKERAAEFLQYLGYLAMNNTTPAIFETTFKGKMAKDDYTIDSFDVIKTSITFDIGRAFDMYTDTMFPNLLTNAITQNIPWTSQMSAAKRKLFDKQIQNKANKTILEIIEVLE